MARFNDNREYDDNEVSTGMQSGDPMADMLTRAGYTYNPSDEHYEIHRPSSHTYQDQLDDERYRQDLQIESGTHDARMAGLDAAVRRASRVGNPELEAQDESVLAHGRNSLLNEFQPDVNSRQRSAGLNAGQTQSDVYFMPGQQAARADRDAAMLERARVPAEITGEYNLAGHQLDVSEKQREDETRRMLQDQEDRKAFMQMYGNVLTPPKGTKVDPGTLQQLLPLFQAMMQKYRTAAPAPAGR